MQRIITPHPIRWIAILLFLPFCLASTSLQAAAKDTIHQAWPGHYNGDFIRYLTFTIQTGGDDLRSQSNVTANIQSYGKTYTQSLNYNNSWQNWSTHTAEFDVQSDYLTPIFIDKLWLHFSPGSSGPFDTGDNWNLQNLNVTYTTNNGFTATIKQDYGNPLYRFTGDDTDYTIVKEGWYQ